MPQPERQSSSIPAGYTLDTPASSAGVPKGYTLDATPAPSAAPSTTQSTTVQPEQASAISRFATGAKEEAVGMWRGAKEAVTAPPQGHLEKALSWIGTGTGTDPLALKRMLVDPTIEKGKSTVQAAQQGDWAKAMIGGLATLNPLAPDVTKTYEQSARGDVAGAIGHGAVQVGALKGLDLVKDAAKLIERAPTIEQGKIGYVNTARRATDILDSNIRNTGVGARVNQVVAADGTDLARTQSPGKVNGMAATQAMQNVINQTRMGGVAHGFNAQMTMADAKATMTQLGREASRLDRTGKAPEAAATWAAYDALRDETMKRAQELDRLQPGAGHAQAWSGYAKEYRNYMQLHSGVLGHLVEGEPTASLSKLIEHEGQLPELKQWFKKYGVDFSPVEQAVKEGKVLNELTERTGTSLMGKIKLISRHPVLGVPMLLAESQLFKGAGLGGIGSFVLPLIIAGKVGGLLDKAKVHSILVDLGKRLPDLDMQISGDPLGPHQPTYGPVGPGAPGAGGAPPAAAPAGGGPTPAAPTAGGAAATPSGVPPANIPPMSTTGVTERRVASGPYEGPDRRMRTSTGEPLYENTHREAEQRWEDIQAERAAEVAKSRKSKKAKE